MIGLFQLQYMFLAIIYFVVHVARDAEISREIAHFMTLTSIYLYKLSGYLWNICVEKIRYKLVKESVINSSDKL